MSYDRGLHWIYVTSLPVSQWYHVAVDMRKPYWVYGGLQDNGCWRGPSATYFSSGISNDDWIRTCGGDGFKSLVDPSDDRTFYSESQYLGLLRNDSVTNEQRNIRPDQKRGFIQERRNWATWGKPGAPEPELGNAMPPANWDGPFIISPHDSKTLYAGTNQLWKSTNRGDSWVSLGDMTTGVDRSKLRIMTQLPTETTLSLDDGAPYYPTITEISESPAKPGLLYVGTDDGNLQVSQDDGKHWANLTKKFPGLPESMWVSGIEASRHNAGTVYVSFDGHRSNDFANYLYRSTDFGNTWTSIAGTMPANRVIHAVHEDPKNPNLLYAATEHGLYISPDAGAHWIELRNNMPRVPINDLVIHPRENDLILASHGRGVWILDDISSLQQLTPAVLAEPVHLFAPRPIEEIRYFNPKAHQGDLTYRGDNPPPGALLDFYLQAAGTPTLRVIDAAGTAVATMTQPAAAGLNRVMWRPRHAALPPGPPDEESGGRSSAAPGAVRAARRVHRAAHRRRAVVRAEAAGARGSADSDSRGGPQAVDGRAAGDRRDLPWRGGGRHRGRWRPRRERPARRRARAAVAPRDALPRHVAVDREADIRSARPDAVLQDGAGRAAQARAAMTPRGARGLGDEPSQPSVRRLA